MPFPPSAALKPISKRFHMPDIPKYNGTTDTNEHETAYTYSIKGNDLAEDERESVLLKKFGETLSKRAMIWYHNLPEHSIDSFAILADAFVKAHAGAIKVETQKSNLFNVKQRDNETLREFVARFQIERMDLPPVTDDWAVQAFTQGLNSRSSITSMELKQNLRPSKGNDRSRRITDRESRPSYDRYQPYPPDRRSNGRNGEPIKNDRRSDQDQNNHGVMNRNAVDRSSGNKEIPILSEYNFCVDVATIAAAISRNRETKHPRPIQSDPEKWDKSLICKYHHTHGHRTEDCRQLREEVARLFNLGHLREFLSERAKTHFKNVDANKQDRPEEPQQVIHMIMGGTDIPQGPVARPISPNGVSSSNLGLLDQIVPAVRVLNEFNMACEMTKGEITLPFNTAGTTQQTKFYVIEGDMRYNALLGKPWIHLMKAVPSTLHQALEFSTSKGIKTVHSEQQAAKEMFAVEQAVTTAKIPEWNEGESAK
ncbi:uncharacterized protein LOC132057946 [Lycium ferocissimum]|uniref:uncharacterized protein LOC132057946 n=1 Tax=Lycium ferocissimum TaxID=112874 RepID=UPI0028163039|nr:uncharacterized protein LOC132057946 [Lycium ferocissimum]